MDFPSRLIFKPIVECPRIEGITIDGDLAEWATVPELPALCALDGEEPYARVQIAWNDAGFYVALTVPRSEPVTANRQRPQSADSLQIWLDTRGSGGGHRATRFCHHFILLPRGGGPQRTRPFGWQQHIRRAYDQSTLATEAQIAVEIRQDEHDYILEAQLPTAILQGFEPEPGQVMGFTYLVTDIEHRRQTWAAGQEFPFDYDPSLWGSIRLGGTV